MTSARKKTRETRAGLTGMTPSFRDGLNSSWQPVELAVLCFQVAEVRLRADAAAGDPLDQLLGLELAAVLVQPFAQPAEQHREVAAAELLVARRVLAGERVPQLRRDQVSQRIGGEVPEEPGRP